MKLLLPLSCVFAGNNISTRSEVECQNITPHISEPGGPVLALLPDHLRPLPRPAPDPGRGGGRGLAAALQLRGKQVDMSHMMKSRGPVKKPLADTRVTATATRTMTPSSSSSTPRATSPGRSPWCPQTRSTPTPWRSSPSTRCSSSM